MSDMFWAHDGRAGMPLEEGEVPSHVHQIILDTQLAPIPVGC